MTRDAMATGTRIRNVFILLFFLAPLTSCSYFVPTENGRTAPESRTAEITELQRFEYTQVHMGVQARIVLYAPDTSTARSAVQAAFDRVAKLDEVMSDYRVDSELMTLSRASGTGPVEAGDDLFTVLTLAQRLAHLTSGAFDVTVGPYVALWRQARKNRRLPSEAELEAAGRRSGWTKIVLNPTDRTVTLAADSMRLDLGGIAKGYAADEALSVLRDLNIRKAMIEFGGDVVAGDPPPGEPGWRITAALLPATEADLILANEAVSTSGDTQQFVEIGGQRYSHVVDPRTGYGLTSRVAATVVAPRAVLSDALATALSVMGAEDGLALIDGHFPDVSAHVRVLSSDTE